MALSRKHENTTTTMLLLASAAVLLATVAPVAESAIDLSSLTVTFQSCASYVEGGTQSVPADCCKNLKSVVGKASSAADWQTLCFFLQPITHYNNGKYTSLIASLPDKCGVDFHFKIGTNIDCSKVA